MPVCDVHVLVLRQYAIALNVLVLEVHDRARREIARRRKSDCKV